jgi:hypothetical protein
VESLAASEALSELVSSGVVTGLNRDNESSLKLSADNFCGCDLLSEDDRRMAGFDEPSHFGPEMASVCCPETFACNREGLAGRRPAPDRPVLRPPCETQGVGPSENAAEEVALGEASEVIRGNVSDASFVDFAIWHQSRLDEVPRPFAAVRVNVVVVRSNG